MGVWSCNLGVEGMMLEKIDSIRNGVFFSSSMLENPFNLRFTFFLFSEFMVEVICHLNCLLPLTHFF